MACPFNTEMKIWELVKQRQLGFVSNSFYWPLYEQLDCVKKISKSDGVGIGSVNNISYSPNGKCLVAVGESGGMVVVDPYNKQVVSSAPRYPSSGYGASACNVVTFTSDLTFVTGYDNSNICLWDLRKADKSVSEVVDMRRYKRQIKSLEYHKASGSLLVSYYKGNPMRFFIDRSQTEIMPAEMELFSAQTFTFDVCSLSRIKLSPCGNSLYVSVEGSAAIFAIHNLELKTLRNDMRKLRLMEWERNGEIFLLLDSYSDPRFAFLNEEQVKEMNSKPCVGRNRVEYYQGVPGSMRQRGTTSMYSCVSMDVDRDNMTVLARYDEHQGSQVVVAAHSVNIPDEPAVARGTRTHMHVRSAPDEGGRKFPVEWIQELHMSPCRRFLAVPIATSLDVFAFDPGRRDAYEHSLAPHRGRNSAPLHRMRTLESGYALSAAFSPDGSALTVATFDGELKFYEPTV